ncbi:MAG: NAD(+) synthase [Defluviitaleaceae bacterium]|nr:NAD(+) synthase [Defluviitaleaceae bacterium]
MRDYTKETENRVNFIREVVASAGVSGIIFGNSGGKDSALVGILCKLACENTVSVVLPCGVPRGYNQDKQDALALAAQFNIHTRSIDLASTQDALLQAIDCKASLTKDALINISPRLRMATLYAVANSENRLVAGTDNLSEIHMGYYTKWGDGAYDFNPIGDLTATEVLEFLRYLNAPAAIIEKAPSAGLFDGQTDEDEMGVTYASIDKFLTTGETTAQDMAIINRYHKASGHKRAMPLIYSSTNLG